MDNSQPKQSTRKPIAILIADVHYSLNTLGEADTSIKLAAALAYKLNVPLIVAGDLHDTKALLRAECVNTMIQTFSNLKCPTTVLVGNHCRISEKAKEHSLHFLKPYVKLVNEPETHLGLNLIPYESNPDVLLDYLKTINRTKITIMHQGIKNANGGHYFHDASAIPASALHGMIVVSGHYHARQTIQLPGGGTFDYVGNPYTLNFGEANDPEKGFQVLYEDGSLEFIPTGLRRHAIREISAKDLLTHDVRFCTDDILWLKVTGTQDELSKIIRSDLIKRGYPETLKLDLIPNETQFKEVRQDNLSQEELLDSVIDSINTDDSQKQLLKNMWREMR